MGASAMLVSMVFSTVGFGYFIYGKRQSEGWFMLAGAVLCIYPYMISGPVLMFLIGVVLMAVPFFARRFES